jgi:hypothetical protein
LPYSSNRLASSAMLRFSFDSTSSFSLRPPSMNPLTSSPPRDFFGSMAEARTTIASSPTPLGRARRLRRARPNGVPRPSDGYARDRSIGSLLTLPGDLPRPRLVASSRASGPSRQAATTFSPCRSSFQGPSTRYSVRPRTTPKPSGGQTHLTYGRLPPTRRSRPVAPPAWYARDLSLKALDCIPLIIFICEQFR